MSDHLGFQPQRRSQQRAQCFLPGAGAAKSTYGPDISPDLYRLPVHCRSAKAHILSHPTIVRRRTRYFICLMGHLRLISRLDVRQITFTCLNLQKSPPNCRKITN